MAAKSTVLDKRGSRRACPGFVDLNSGDWVVQNAANSGVGRWVIAVAKSRGLRTVNSVRRPELADKLKMIGRDVIVVVNSPDVAGRIKEAVVLDELHLALDGVSGPAIGVLASTLSLPALFGCIASRLHAHLATFRACSQAGAGPLARVNLPRMSETRPRTCGESH
jgi:NADPH:quinone reductase-like Zn-dependent oxidoreductase